MKIKYILDRINSCLIFIALILIYIIVMEYLIDNRMMSSLFVMLFTPLTIIGSFIISKLYLLYQKNE